MVKFNEQLTDSLAQSVLNTSVWERTGVDVKKPKVEESKKVETPAKEEEEVVVESEDEVEETHVCPLCESQLEAPVSKEVLAEFTNAVLEVLNEMTELDEDAEVLEEDTEEEAVEDSDEDDSEEE